MNVPRTRSSLFLTLAALLLFYFTLRGRFPSGLSSGSTPPEDGSAAQNALRDIGLTTTFEYQRLCLRPQKDRFLTRTNHDHFDVDGKILQKSARIGVDSIEVQSTLGKPVLPPCQSTIDIKVPAPKDEPKVDPKTLVLGMATSLSRLEQSLPEMAHWLSGTGSPLFVILRDVDDAKSTATSAASKLANDLKIDLTLVSHRDIASPKPKRDAQPADSTTDEPSNEATSNFGLAPLISARAPRGADWLLILDDDTYLPSLPRLLSSLSRFPPHLPHYIGALSERHLGMQTEGFKAWGGAGILLSMPLVQTLSANYSRCVDMAGTWGDALWRDCIAAVTSPTVQLETLDGLHQLDLFPSLDGWYESAPWPLLTLHHWKSWHSFNVPEAHLVSDMVGQEGFLGRWVWKGERVVLSNGYSIVQYPGGVPELGLVEGTSIPYPEAVLADGEREYRYSLGRLRKKLERGKEKATWGLERTVRTREGISQVYVRRADSGMGWDVDSVIEVDWVR